LTSDAASCITDFTIKNIVDDGMEVTGVVGLAADPSASNWQSQTKPPKSFLAAMQEAGVIDDQVIAFALLDSDSYTDVGFYDTSAITSDLVWIDV
jgi:hypothetical protein